MKFEIPGPEYLLNRELSLVEFNRRVLDQAKDADTPLLERVRFLTISCSNLDEFFEIRVAGLKEQAVSANRTAGPDGLMPDEALRRISVAVHGLVEEQYRVLNDVLFPALEAENIRILRRGHWSSAVQQWVRDYFEQEVLPVLTPVGLDPAHPLPPVTNKSLNFAVSVSGEDAFGRDSGIAVVQAPRSLPRIIGLPDYVGAGPHDYVLLSSIIHAHVEDLFPGMDVLGCYQFRVTRNSDLWVDEEEVDDLLHALQGELPRRRFGDAVRLEVADTCTPEMSAFLLGKFHLDDGDLYKASGPVNLHRLDTLYKLVDRTDLKYAPFVPTVPKELLLGTNMFEFIRRGDLLLHHPYESFNPVVEFIWQAAKDPSVLAIKQTLYRTGPNSPIADALIAAARSGKEVTAVIELRARFDEEANIDLATRLQKAGANVVYGVVGYKTHAKMLLIVRREDEGLKRYVHLATGNYHTLTARAYTDLSILTCDSDIGADVHTMFQQLTGLGVVRPLKKIIQSPFTLHAKLLDHIGREAEAAARGEPARIIVKVNSLSEPLVIQALYAASNAGVKISLIVRGICCLRPGIKGVSENIEVRSIIGRFLEHSRVFYFFDGGAESIYASSADWMQRNLFRRVESCFPIEDSRLKKRVFDECLASALDDNLQTWLMRADGSYFRPGVRDGATRLSCQQQLLQKVSGNKEVNTSDPI